MPRYAYEATIRFVLRQNIELRKMMFSIIKSTEKSLLQLSPTTPLRTILFENSKYEPLKNRQLIFKLNSSSKLLFFFFFLPMLPFVQTFSPHSAFRECSKLQILRLLVLYVTLSALMPNVPHVLQVPCALHTLCCISCLVAPVCRSSCFLSVLPICVFFQSGLRLITMI